MSKKGILVGLGIGLVIMFLIETPLIIYFANKDVISSYLPTFTNTEYESFEDKADDVIEYLEKYYYEDIDDDMIYEEAIRGLVESTGDPYTTYFTEEEYTSFNEKMEGSYEGIGVVVSYGETEDEILVVAPFKESPGEVAGLKSNDRIIKVDGVDIIGESLDKAVERIKGEKGTDVVLTIIRDGEEMDITVTRDVIEIPTIDYELLDDNIGYIGISGFDQVTAEQFDEAIAELESQGLEGLIIDLRYNPGGYLHIAYEIADRLLIEDQLVVYTEDKYGNKESYVTETKEAFDKPIVVLVNGSSASASEILSGALQDHEVGVLVGETTFGKGLVQRPFVLDDGSMIKITISKYYTPDGSYIHGVGIEPDYVIEDDIETEEDEQLDKAIEVMEDLLN